MQFKVMHCYADIGGSTFSSRLRFPQLRKCESGALKVEAARKGRLFLFRACLESGRSVMHLPIGV
jgi:hypothetical protein